MSPDTAEMAVVEVPPASAPFVPHAPARRRITGGLREPTVGAPTLGGPALGAPAIETGLRRGWRTRAAEWVAADPARTAALRDTWRALWLLAAARVGGGRGDGSDARLRAGARRVRPAGGDERVRVARRSVGGAGGALGRGLVPRDRPLRLPARARRTTPPRATRSSPSTRWAWARSPGSACNRCSPGCCSRCSRSCSRSTASTGSRRSNSPARAERAPGTWRNSRCT